MVLNRSINIHKRLPAEAFRLLEQHFGSKGFGKIAGEIRRREVMGLMPEGLRDANNPLPLKVRHHNKRRNKRRRTQYEVYSDEDSVVEG